MATRLNSLESAVNTTRLRCKNWGYDSVVPTADQTCHVVIWGILTVFHKANRLWAIDNHPTSTESISVSGVAVVIQYDVSKHWRP